MNWCIERKSMNDRPSHWAHTMRGDYCVVPVHGGFRLHFRPRGSASWSVDESRPKLRWAKERAAELDASTLAK
jgi:hypothetical protein